MRRPETKSKPAPARAPAPGPARPPFPVWLLAILLVLTTIALYWPAMEYDFVNCDDPGYVTANPHVQGGLNWDTVKWAFCNPVVGNWHPLTVISHMLDCQLFGLNPWGHHLINVLLHALNAALVFVLLRQSSGSVWRSLLVAALFAVHPLHVESVAWVAERKDVLSGFFGLLSLIFYVRYAQIKKQIHPPPSTLSYALALLFFALGLMSKPMLVTWPFVMLLLDYWPLGRFTIHELPITTSQLHPSLATRHASLLLEKLPFFALAAVASCVTFVVQQQGGAVMTIENLPLGARFGNALVSYCRYLGKLFWPTDLAVFYPYTGHWPLAEVLLAGLLLVVISVLFFVKRQQCPFLLMGWLWFVGTLVPVIGLVQVGQQAMADRYSYLPSVGLFILVIWGAYQLTLRWRYQVMVLSVAGSAVLVVCIALTRQQLGYWSDSTTLFQHALAVTENNYIAHLNLGVALKEQGQTDKAIRQYREAIRLKPDYADAHYNLGTALARKGQLDEAIPQFEEAIRLKPDLAEAHYNLGVALDQKGQLNEAIRQLQETIRLKPDNADAHNNLGVALEKEGQLDEAIRQYQETIRLKPDNAVAHYNLGTALDKKDQLDKAIAQFKEAIRLKPDFAEAHYKLGIALASKGRFDGAIENYRKAIQINPAQPETFVCLGMALNQAGRTREGVDAYKEALRLNPNLPGALNNLAWILATSPDDQLRNGTEAVRLAERACELTHDGEPLFIGTLAAAYAESGRFPEAVATAEKAEQLATAAGQAAVAAKNQQLLGLYRTGKPYHEPPATASSSPQTPSQRPEQ